MKFILWLMMTLPFVALSIANEGQSTTAGVIFIDSNKVAAAFAMGMPLLKNK